MKEKRENLLKLTGEQKAVTEIERKPGHLLN
jgi:hypothetical protein